MKYIIFIFILITTLSANILISSKNLKTLNLLNIENSFINDRNTQKIYHYYLKHKKEKFLIMLKNSYPYIPLIKNEIQKAHIPNNLIFVAMAESFFSSKAKSNKKAIGLWQFMPKTAKRFNLKINKYIDERKDPIKSTVAALTYLTNLKQKLGKWYLAIMAYNCGEGRIIEGITRAKLDKYCKVHKCRNNKTFHKYRKIITNYQYHNGRFTSLYKVYNEINKLEKSLTLKEILRYQKGLKRQYLPKETRLYIRKIIAMNFLLNSNKFIKYQNHNLLNRGILSNLIRINVPPRTSLKYIANLLNMKYKTLRNQNMHLRYPFTPPNENSYIYIPYAKLALFKLTFNPKNIKRKIVYKVKKGDSLRRIGKKFHISHNKIKELNHLKTNMIYVNQKLVIPLYISSK